MEALPARPGAALHDHRLPLAQNVLRNLGDGSYDRRKSAALVVQQQVKGWHDRGGVLLIARVIDGLSNEFVHSPHPSHQKGGLIALAACSIGLQGCGTASLERHVGDLLRVVLGCFEDRDHRVKYYACEALYNIAQVARSLVIPHFGLVFDGLVRLTVDVDSLVKKAAALLDRLLKDIVTESEASFEFDAFVALLKDRRYLSNANAHVRKLLLSWIDVLLDVPGADVLDLLPELLEFIFNMCGDKNRNNQQHALKSLDSLLLEVTGGGEEHSGDMPGRDGDDSGSRLQFEAVVGVLCRQALLTGHEGALQRFKAITWLKEVIDLGGERLAPQFAAILEAVIHCVSDEEAEPLALHADDKLWHLVQRTVARQQHGNIVVDVGALLEQLGCGMQKSEHTGTTHIVVCLRWVAMLVDGDSLGSHVLREQLLDQLEHPKDEVAEGAVAAIARFRDITTEVAMLLFESPMLLESRGSLIIRHLTTRLGPTFFLELALTLQQLEGQRVSYEFLSLVACLMSHALLTAPELEQLRAELRLGDGSGTRFRTLFRTWCHNPVAVLSLGLLAQAYDLAQQLVRSFRDIDLTVNFPGQAAQLVQLLESPAFLPLRLELVEISSAQHAALLTSLSGLLLLLPQHTDAFQTLHTRLSSVSVWTLGQRAPSGVVGAASGVDEMLARFIEVQGQHEKERASLSAKEAEAVAAAAAKAGWRYV